MAYIGQQPVVGRYILLDQISGGFNGTTSGFTMSTAGGVQGVKPGLAQNVLLSLGGVIQQPGVDYTISGSGITFTTPPVAGTTFFATVLGDAQSVGTPSDGTVTPASIAAGFDFAFPNVNVTGVTTIASGVAATPSLSITGDADTGLFSSAANSVSVSTGGSERLRIDDSGRLLIGSSVAGNADADNINVAGAGNVGITFRGSSSGTGNIFFADSTSGDDLKRGQIVYDHSSNSMRVHTNAVERMRIDGSGRLLVGTSTSPSGGDGHAQKARLLVRGRVDSDADSGRLNLQRGSAASNGSSIGSISFTDSSNNIYARIESFGDATPGTDDYPGRITFSTTADGASSVTERMRIDRTGRVLIGSGAISNPKANTGGIDVSTHNIAIVFGGSSLSGTDTLRANNATKDGRIAAAHYANAEEPVGVIRVVSNSSENQLHWGGGSSIINAATDHQFYTASDNTTTGGSERMRISSSGRVLIAKSATNFANVGIELRENGEIVATRSGGDVITTRRLVSEGTHFSFRNISGTLVGTIVTSSSSTTYNTSSDYRLKENVVDITDGITRVKKLQPKRFNFIVDAETTVDGFLAHEAQTVVPEAVTGTHNEVDDDGNAVMQGIDQSKLVPLLTAALQEAIAKIETLEASNTDLLARVTALES